MRREIPRVIERYDAIVNTITTLSLSAPGIAQALGINGLVIWVPVICYIIWMVEKRLRYKTITDYPEYATLERIRAVSYLFSLGITLIGNFLMLTILPRTFDTFIPGIIMIPTLLMMTAFTVPLSLFRREMRYMDEHQDREVRKILRDVGSASIFLSISILMLPIEFVASQSFSINYILENIAIPLALFAVGLYRDWSSKKLVRELADSLLNSGWYNEYMGT